MISLRHGEADSHLKLLCLFILDIYKVFESGLHS